MTKEQLKEFTKRMTEVSGLSEEQLAEKINNAVEGESRPSIPSNLDEAAEAIAEKYATKVFGKVDTHEHIDHNGRNECRALYSIGCIEGFKAGAEWQLNEDSKKHYFVQLKNIKEAWQELKKSNPGTESKPAVCFYKGAEWMAEQYEKIEGEPVDWYGTSDGKDYCCGIKTVDSFEVPEGFYIRKKQ